METLPLPPQAAPPPPPATTLYIQTTDRGIVKFGTQRLQQRKKTYQITRSPSQIWAGASPAQC